MSDTTQKSLLVRIRNGDEIAWQEFYDLYRPLIRWAARRWGLTGQEVDDAVQEVMLDLFKGQKTFVYDRSKGRFRDYLYVLARRRAGAVRNARDRGGRETLMEDPPEPAADDRRAEWDAQWQEHILRQALETVKSQVEPKTFAAFEDYELKGKDAKAVADALGLSQDTVYMYKRRVVRRLKAVMEEMGEP